LRAELTVLRALAGFGIGNAAKDDFLAFEVFPYFGSGGQNYPGGVGCFDKEFQSFRRADGGILFDDLIFRLIY
jgi:hypothetical protein